MKRIIALVGIIVLMATKIQAQNKETKDKIEVARIAYITEKLGLTPEQAEKFWPLYREYTDKKMEVRGEFQQAKRKVKKENMSDEESQELIDLAMNLKEKELNIDKDYTERLQRVITNRQVLELRKAEDDFRKILLRRLEQRKEHGERNNRAGERLEKRNNQ